MESGIEPNLRGHEPLVLYLYTTPSSFRGPGYPAHLPIYLHLANDISFSDHVAEDKPTTPNRGSPDLLSLFSI